MHDLSGHSHFYDRIHRVLLSNFLELETTGKEARFLVAPMSGGKAEAIIFDHPLIVAALSDLATAFEELGQSTKPGIPVGKRSTWMICPTCHRKGWDENNHGDWHECPTCEGAGTIIIRP